VTTVWVFVVVTIVRGLFLSGSQFSSQGFSLTAVTTCRVSEASSPFVGLRSVCTTSGSYLPAILSWCVSWYLRSWRRLVFALPQRSTRYCGVVGNLCDTCWISKSSKWETSMLACKLAPCVQVVARCITLNTFQTYPAAQDYGW
jgi:hypothetical protein